MNTKNQIKLLKCIFKTKDIINKSSKDRFSNDEIDDIIKNLQERKSDGKIKISNNVVLHLLKGVAIISDK